MLILVLIFCSCSNNDIQINIVKNDLLKKQNISKIELELFKFTNTN